MVFMFMRSTKSIQRFEQRTVAADMRMDISTIRKQIDTPTRIKLSTAAADAAGIFERFVENGKTREQNDKNPQAIVVPDDSGSSTGNKLDGDMLTAGSDTLNAGTGSFTECLEGIAQIFR